MAERLAVADPKGMYFAIESRAWRDPGWLPYVVPSLRSRSSYSETSASSRWRPAPRAAGPTSRPPTPTSRTSPPQLTKSFACWTSA